MRQSQSRFKLDKFAILLSIKMDRIAKSAQKNSYNIVKAIKHKRTKPLQV
jgi:hypothetical protein